MSCRFLSCSRRCVNWASRATGRDGRQGWQGGESGCPATIRCSSSTRARPCAMVSPCLRTAARARNGAAMATRGRVSRKLRPGCSAGALRMRMRTLQTQHWGLAVGNLSEAETPRWTASLGSGSSLAPEKQGIEPDLAVRFSRTAPTAASLRQAPREGAAIQRQLHRQRPPPTIATGSRVHMPWPLPTACSRHQ